MAEEKFETAEGRLCGAIAAAMARFIDGTVEQGGLEGHSIGNLDLSEWAQAADALNLIGVLRSRVSADIANHSWLVFAMDAGDMPAYLARHIDAHDPRVGILLQAFIGLACRYGDLHDDADWFMPPVWLAEVLPLMAAQGYAEQDRDRFRWAAKIATVMQAEYLWDEQGRCQRLNDEEREFRLTELVWTSMPDDLKRFSYDVVERFIFARVRNPRPNAGRLAFLMGHYWNAGKENWEWDGVLKPETFKILRGGHLGRASHIVTMIQSGLWRT